MSNFARRFTLEEANAALPRLKRVFRVIHALLSGSPLPGEQALLATYPYLPSETVDGIAKLESKMRQKGAMALLAEEVQSRGIIIQDVWRGLIDFPYVRADGEEVLLCYELADGDRIVAFHPLETGFSGRRPIEELEA